MKQFMSFSIVSPILCMTILCQLSCNNSLLLVEAQETLPSIQNDGKLSEEDLLPYQTCTSDSDCISFTNGVCDCANGGDEVSIHSDFSPTLEAIFAAAGPRPCTKIASEIPCGFGAGSICHQSKCHFRPCADVAKASQCRVEDDSNSTDPVQDYEDCLWEACAIASEEKEDSTSSSTISSTIEERPAISNALPSRPSPILRPPPPGFLPPSLVREGKFTTNEMKQFQSCQTDSDCTYVNNGFCDCANGGEEQAVHISREEDFETIFDGTPYRCTKMMRDLPCGIGAGVICNSQKRCEFQSCRDTASALEECRAENVSALDRMTCLEESCADGEVVSEESEEDQGGIFGGFWGNLKGDREGEKQLRPGKIP